MFFIIEQLIEKQLAFIDLEKAHDSVPRSNLWKFMADIEINKTTLIKLY